jgi:NAD(P)-dependent dehydrogenase (short-subunit alcohol dehydrogenase family)
MGGRRLTLKMVAVGEIVWRAGLETMRNASPRSESAELGSLLTCGGADRRVSYARGERRPPVSGIDGNQRAVVTGAASGIGQAVALRLLDDGADVVAVDFNEVGLKRVAESGGHPLAADLARADDRKSVIAAAEGCDYLVNAAGIIRLSPIFEAPPEDWRDIFAVNAEAVFFLCQAIGPRMRPGGAIVNLSSTSAKASGTTEAAIYAASKAAVISMTRSFAYALASRPVRVNAVCPGITDTPMQDRVLDEVARLRGTTFDALAQGRLSGVPLGRTSSPAECAGLINFLLREESGYMTGQAINFSGGLVMT